MSNPNHHQHHQQQLTPRGLVANSNDSSLGQSSQVMAQLASQVQASVGVNPQLAAAQNPYSQASALPANPNLVALPQYAPIQPLAPMQIPTVPQVPGLGAAQLWNPSLGPPQNVNNLRAAAAYQIPSNWSGSNMAMSSPGNPVLPSQPAPPSQNESASNNNKGSIHPSMVTSSIIPPDPESRSRANKNEGGGRTSKARSYSDADEDGDEYASPSTKAKKNRDRNREHARSTRLRKKAYVQKLKEMAEGLRAIQTAEIRQRRRAVHQMTEMQKTRKQLVHKFLHLHSNFEGDIDVWREVTDESFWLKQPVTPFRSFRRSEVERDCRIVRGIEAVICDAASIATMVERTGSLNARWQRIKRRQFERTLELSGVQLPSMAASQRVESSLSSSSSTTSSDDSLSKPSNNNGGAAEPDSAPLGNTTLGAASAKKQVSSSSGESNIGRKRKRSKEAKAGSSGLTGQVSTSSETESSIGAPTNAVKTAGFPSNIARSGGIVHNVSVMLNAPPAKPIGSQLGHQRTQRKVPSHAPLSVVQLKERDSEEISAYYAMNEDDMIMIDDVLMCPFVFRTRNAVLCGALTDCVMPGMIRANFSKENKLQSMEMVYDAMGFMQQLDGANGGHVTAQVIPGSLEMALMSSPNEARVITEARPPYAVVHVNEAWTRLTKYTQLEVEGQEFLSLIEGECTDPSAKERPGKPHHKLEEVARGRSACSTNLHYDKNGKSFVDFMCSYPLTNDADEICHLLHVSLELSKDHALI